MLDWLMELPFADVPLLAYARARSAYFSAQYAMASRMVPRSRQADLQTLMAVLSARDALLREDVAHIRAGLYPPDVLLPEPPHEHFGRVPRLLADALGTTLRILSGQTAVFSDQAARYLEGLPPYFRRNYHHQTDGYLSEASAELYEHQVELLFGGAADAMRRLVVPPLKAALGSTGRGLTFLEIAAGTGRATRSVRLAFPEARIVVTEISPPYLSVARRRLSPFAGLDFVQADGSDLPFKDRTFDAVYSVFLFHEIPSRVRKKVLAESMRVLRPGGVAAAVDALQRGDVPPFDPLLEEFPRGFHEPFFLDYLGDRLEDLWKQTRFEGIGPGSGLLSKVVWGVKAT